MEYKAVGRGSLKLKGGPSTKDGGVKKKRKQTNPIDKQNKTGQKTETATDAKETVEATDTNDLRDGGDTRTPAQRKFDEIRRLREETTARQRAGQSHRERIEAMNAHLARLSEHNDMPKIGPG